MNEFGELVLTADAMGEHRETVEVGIGRYGVYAKFLDSLGDTTICSYEYDAAGRSNYDSEDTMVRPSTGFDVEAALHFAVDEIDIALAESVDSPAKHER